MNTMWPIYIKLVELIGGLSTAGNIVTLTEHYLPSEGDEHKQKKLVRGETQVNDSESKVDVDFRHLAGLSQPVRPQFRWAYYKVYHAPNKGCQSTVPRIKCMSTKEESQNTI
jgi:hypothetical protein